MATSPAHDSTTELIPCCLSPSLPHKCSEAEELAFFSIFNQAVAQVVETLGVGSLQFHDYHGGFCEVEGWGRTLGLVALHKLEC